jgi:hypothetical protein
MVMDNLPAHNCEDACELIEGRGCELLLVPTFARLSSERGGVLEDKALLRKAEERTQEALIEAQGALRSQQLRPRMSEASLSTVATGKGVECYDECCKSLLVPPRKLTTGPAPRWILA